MASSGKVSCIVFVMHVEYLLLRVMCVLMHVHVLVGVNVSVIICILVWIRVHVCIAPSIVVGAWPMAGTLWRLFEYYYSRSQFMTSPPPVVAKLPSVLISSSGTHVYMYMYIAIIYTHVAVHTHAS